MSFLSAMIIKFKYKLCAITLVYLSLLSLFILYYNIAFSSTNVDSARYLLSTLVQSEAAIIAVTITLSLVAVQLAASSYSARLIDLFKESYSFWLIIVVYIFAMAYESGVLKQIQPLSNTISTNSSLTLFSNLEFHISLSYILSIIVFTLLIPHIWITLDLIKPSTIINKISDKITLENIQNASRPESEDDPIEPITSIIVRSLERHDEGTVILGLNKLSEKIVSLFDSKDLSDMQKDKVEEFISYHFSLIGRLAVNSGDIYASSNVIAALKPVVDKSIEKEFAENAIKTIDIIAAIGEKGVENELGAVAEEASDVLKDLGRKVIDHGNKLDNVAQHIVACIRKIAIKTIRNGLKSESSHVTTNLGAIGLTFSRSSFGAASSEAISSLERIASECAIQKDKDTAIIAETYIHNIGLHAVKNRLYGAVGQAVRSSEIIIENAAKYNFLEIVGRLVGAIKSIGEEFIIKLQLPDDTEIYTEVANEIIRNLAKIAEIISQQEGFDKRHEFVSKLAEDLGQFGRISAERGLDSPASIAAGSFIRFGSFLDKEMVRKYLKSILEASSDANTCVQVARSFNELATSFRDLSFSVEAEESSKKAISIDPNNAKAYLQLQHALSAQAVSLSNSDDKERSKDKQEAADKALAKHKELEGN
jgi:hypothetical protein